MSFTAKERTFIINKYTEAVRRRDEISDRMYWGDGALQDRLEPEFEKLQQQVSDIVEEYMAGVPVMPVSRCPFTGLTVNQSIDTFGLDGMWWNYEAAARPAVELPETYFALTGAVRLSILVENFQFLCVPGPEMPYVVPRLLNYDGIRAVLSTVRVGVHQAFMVFYFASPMVYGIDRVNDWASDSYTYENAEGDSFWESNDVTPDDMDFDLKK